MIDEKEDLIDSLNDTLTDITAGEFDGITAVGALVSQIEKLLVENGLKLDFTDVENLFQDWEEPTEFEAVNVTFPLYDEGNGDTQYNLSLTYASAEPGTRLYMVDAEVQYEWEVDDEIETVYIELDE